MRKLCIVLALVSLCTIVGTSKAASKKHPLTASAIVPGARGYVEVGKDKNDNDRVKMVVEHLANPQNLTPPAAVYVVWFQDMGGTPQNKGQLKVDKNLKASFESVTSSKSFMLFVTGERDSSVTVPSSTEVFRLMIQQ
jgi:hypothetical protein